MNKSKWLLLTLAILTVGCQKSLYEIQTTGGYENLEERSSLAKEILILDEYYTTKLDIDLIKNQINKNKFNLDEWQGLDTSMKVFLEAIILIRQDEYELALERLEKLDDNTYHCQVKVLRIDCNFELGKKLDFQQLYQQAFDCSGNEYVKQLIKQRFKHVKYSL